MLTINDIQDLREIGMNCLTGEACPWSRRLLFDLTARAAKAVSGVMSLRPDAFAPNWNSGSQDDPAIASIMLTREMALECTPWLLMEYGYHTVIQHKGMYGDKWTGLAEGEKYDDRSFCQELDSEYNIPQWVENRVLIHLDGKEEGINSWKVGRVLCKPKSQPGIVTTDGYNNIHQMSGRGR